MNKFDINHKIFDALDSKCLVTAIRMISPEELRAYIVDMDDAEDAIKRNMLHDMLDHVRHKATIKSIDDPASLTRTYKAQMVIFNMEEWREFAEKLADGILESYLKAGEQTRG